MRAAIYTRISDDRSGEGAGVKRQREACEKLAADRGLRVVAVFEDNSRSAMRGERPAYDHMLRAVAAREVDVVLVWATDRLYRRLEELITLTKTLRDVPVFSVRSGDVDLSNADGQLKANLLGSVAQHESQKKGERVREAAAQRAAGGRFSGGRRRFGYTQRDTDTKTGRPTGPLVLVADEADAIAWAYRHVMSGGALEAIVREWRQRELRGPGGAAFTGVTVRDVLLRPMNAGLAVYQGRVVGPSKAPAIVDVETFETVRAILTDPKRRTTVGRPPKSLLAPFLRCSVCEGRMSARNRRRGPKRGGGKTAIYACRDGHVSRTRALLDEHVEELVLRSIDQNSDMLRRPVATVSPRVSEAAREAEHLRDRLAGLSALAAVPVEDGGLEPADYAKAAAAVRTRLADVELRIVSNTGRPATAALVSSGDIRGTWARLDDEARRAVLAELLVRIVVGPGQPGRFNTDDVHCHWQENPAD